MKLFRRPLVRQLAFLLPVLTACTVLPDDEPNAGGGAWRAREQEALSRDASLADADESVVAEASVTRPATVASEVWSSPAFQRQFAQALISETEIEPDVTLEEQDALREVSELLGADQLERAVALLDRLRDDESSARLDYTRGYFHFQADELDDAAREFERAVAKHPKFRRAWRMLGMTHLRRERYDRSLEAFTKVVESGGGDALTFGFFGFAHLASGNPLAAESAYRMAVLLDPETLDLQLGLARAFFGQARFAEAAVLCGRLIERNPENADLWLLQANAYVGMNDVTLAAQNFEMLDRLGGSTPSSLQNLGDIYVNQGVFGAGVDAHLRALDQGESVPADRALRAARSLTARRAFDESKQLLAGIEEVAAARLDDEQRKTLLDLRVRVAVAEGATEEERAALERIVELDPLDGSALILLAQHAVRAGDAERAMFLFERADGIEASAPDAKVGMAKLLAKEKKYAEAVALLRGAQEAKPRESVQRYLEQLEGYVRGR